MRDAEPTDMYSKARIAGHPIHPMVVAFPIALFTATVGALLAFIGTRDTFYFRAAMTAGAAGCTMALLAAIPGAVDLFALPKGSRARATGMKHAGFGLATVGIFAASTALMVHNWSTKMMVDGVWELDATVPLAIGVVGLVTLVIVGSLGWTLVQKHHVGIKPAHVRANLPSREPEFEGVRGAAYATHH